MSHCLILLNIPQRSMSHVRVPTASEGLVAVKGRWLSETKKGCSGSPVAPSRMFTVRAARATGVASQVALSVFLFFFSLFYFPFCCIHVQTNTIMILAIAKTNRNRSSNLSHIDTHSHTGTYKHRSTHITTCTYRHIYTHIPLPHIHIHNECTIYHC